MSAIPGISVAHANGRAVSSGSHAAAPGAGLQYLAPGPV